MPFNANLTQFSIKTDCLHNEPLYVPLSINEGAYLNSRTGRDVLSIRNGLIKSHVLKFGYGMLATEVIEVLLTHTCMVAFFSLSESIYVHSGYMRSGTQPLKYRICMVLILAFLHIKDMIV